MIPSRASSVFINSSKVGLLRSGEAFVEVDRIPGVDGFLGDCQRRRAELRKMIDCLLHGVFEIDFRHNRIRQADTGRFPAGDAAPGEHKIGCVLLSNQRGQCR